MFALCSFRRGRLLSSAAKLIFSTCCCPADPRSEQAAYNFFFTSQYGRTCAGFYHHSAVLLLSTNSGHDYFSVFFGHEFIYYNYRLFFTPSPERRPATSSQHTVMPHTNFSPSAASVPASRSRPALHAAASRQPQPAPKPLQPLGLPLPEPHIRSRLGLRLGGSLGLRCGLHLGTRSLGHRPSAVGLGLGRGSGGCLLGSRLRRRLLLLGSLGISSLTCLASAPPFFNHRSSTSPAARHVPFARAHEHALALATCSQPCAAAAGC